MKQSILTGLLVAVLAALPASAQQQRPSINTIDAAQKRLNAAICAKADADEDTYRPFVCEPRCDCLAGLLQSASPVSCDETAPGKFSIRFPAPTGTCAGGICANSSGLGCSGGIPLCPSGEVCVTTCALNICISTCRMPCSSDSSCPGSIAELSGVTAADSPQVVVCKVGTNTRKINSNDALQCLDQVRSLTGACQ